MEMPVRNRLIELLSLKQIAEGRLITQAELVKETGLNKPLISRYMRNDIERFDSSTIEALCRYFNCEVGDLLYLDTNRDKTT